MAWISLARPSIEQARRPTPDDSQIRARIASRYAALHGMTCVVISAGLATAMHSVTRDEAIAGLAAALMPGLSSASDTTAFCCYNDLVAQAVVRVLRERGRRIPQDAAVIGFDNLFADLIDPPLTTIDHCLDEMGRRAAVLALRMIDDPGARASMVGHREVIPARLVLRKSS
jgi:DNA-binding LacI/PurR family transcriptional regulator